MKLNFGNFPRISSDKGQIGRKAQVISRNSRVVMLILLVIALAACTRSQQPSSGGGGGRASGANNPSNPPPPSGDAGSAVLNLRRDGSYDYPTGSDIYSEVGAIPLVFYKSTEGDLIVEGSGKTDWTEVTNFPGCSYTSKAEGKITVTGLFKKEDCKFHLTIATKLSQPTTTYQDQDPDQCIGGIVFSQTEFSSQIELDPATSRFKETGSGGWWETTTVNLSDLKSDEVKLCFTPEVIELPDRDSP